MKNRPKIRPRLDALTKSIAEKVSMAVDAMGYDEAAFVIVIYNPEDHETIVSGNVEIEGTRHLLQSGLDALPVKELILGVGTDPSTGPVKH